MSGALSRRDCVEAAARTWRDACRAADQLTPRQLAEAAHRVGGPTVRDLEAEIRDLRGLPEAGAA